MTKTKKSKDQTPATGAPQDGSTAPEPAPVMVTVVRTGQAPKLNPARSGGAITYQVGRIDGVGIPGVVIRLKDNEGGGQFSREWVPFERLRTCFSPAVLTGQPFKAHVLDSAFQGRSSTNSGFLTAAIRAEGLAYEDTEHRGMSLLNGGFDTWLQGVLDATPEQNEDGTVKQEPLTPPKRENPFSVAKDGAAKKSGGKRPRPATDDAAADMPEADSEGADAEPCMAEA